MNLNRDFKRLLLISFALSLLGFILDLGERIPDLLVNLQDIGMMTVLIFLLIAVIYYPFKFLVQGIRSRT